MVKLFIGAFYRTSPTPNLPNNSFSPRLTCCANLALSGDLLACSWWGYNYIALSGLCWHSLRDIIIALWTSGQNNNPQKSPSGPMV